MILFLFLIIVIGVKANGAVLKIGDNDLKECATNGNVFDFTPLRVSNNKLMLICGSTTSPQLV